MNISNERSSLCVLCRSLTCTHTYITGKGNPKEHSRAPLKALHSAHRASWLMLTVEEHSLRIVSNIYGQSNIREQLPMLLRNVTACMSLPARQTVAFNWNVSSVFSTCSHLPVPTDQPAQGVLHRAEERGVHRRKFFLSMDKIPLGLVLMLHRATHDKRKCQSDF